MRSRPMLFRFALSTAVSLVALAAAHAQTFHQPDLDFTNAVTGLNTPTAMEFAPDGRLFVAEKNGSLRVVKNGVLQSTPFVTLPVGTESERGLLGVAFDPDFANNHFVYAYYTTNGPTRFNRISRFTANGDVAVPGSELVLMNLDAHSAGNHNGGAIHFGADGKLYVGVGDNANRANSQSLSTRHGKILRINSDGSIPTDNPFFNTATGDNRAIWAMGVRNPFTFAVHPTDGDIYINDVGENTWEEINVGAAGANYGWGTNTAPNEGPFDEGANPGFTAPLFAYLHGNDPVNHTLGNTIAGGAFYHPSSLALLPASYTDDYFYADFIRGWIRAIDSQTNTSYLIASDMGSLVDLKVGPDGALYTLNIGNGSVGRIFSNLVVVPEPSTLALFGLALLPFFRYRRNRR